MILINLIALAIFGSDYVLGGRPPPGCNKQKGHPPRHSGGVAVANAYSSSSSSSSSSHASSSSYASSTSIASGSPGCNDFDFCRDKNATYKKCPNPCPGTCVNPEGVKDCYMMCEEFGCECYSGYVWTDDDKCVKLKDCPDYLRCHGDRNATFKECPNPCPRTCKFPGGTGPCAKMCLKEGCECKSDFFLSENEQCVGLQDCPGARHCSANETFVYCNVGCPSNYCPVDDSRAIVACSPPFPCESGCSCKGGYLRNKRGHDRCILAQDCPPVKCTRPNEEWCSCPPPCYTDRCSDIGKPNICDKRFFSCHPQCICKHGFYRNDKDICVPKKKCHPLVCGYNEEASDCKITCPPQTCESIFSTYNCENHTICEPGCNCISEHLRNDSGICIPSNECFVVKPCDVPSECRPTCANPNPQHCPTVPPVSENLDGCKCKPGYILNDSDGICIRIEECPADKGCNGDPNAIATACPWPCPSTCDSPNAGTCGKKCIPVGCQCKPGFLLNKKNGKCILPNKCKCGNPCGVNGTFVDCAFRCPNQNCPEDDSQVQIACKPGRPCPSGCLCKDYYRWKYPNSNKCVLASDCPAVKCTRPHEEWDPCASECLAEKCSDINQDNDCYPDPDNCQPKCVCCDGYYRNSSNYCIPKHKCKPPCPVLPRCRPTCAVPNPPDCPFIQPAEVNDDSCNCQNGYILSERGGRCIKIEDCPDNISCNGDANARVKECPQPCPSTCASPNAVPCKRKCDPIGCECKHGYLLSDLDGTCMLPNDCEGGNPCGPNATFVPCKYNCPSFYCPIDDSRVIPVCETYPFAPCLSGCVCNLNHRIYSRDNPFCIRSDECPPVNCTRPHECWESCPSDCRSEYCEALENPNVICNTLVLNCNPQCRCHKGYLRNPETQKCVCLEECKRINKKQKCSKSHS